MSTCLEPAGISSCLYQSISLPITGCCWQLEIFCVCADFYKYKLIKIRSFTFWFQEKLSLWKISGIKWSVSSNYILKDLDIFVYEQEVLFSWYFPFSKIYIFKRRNHYVNTERYLHCLLTADRQIALYSLKQILFNSSKLRFPDSFK